MPLDRRSFLQVAVAAGSAVAAGASPAFARRRREPLRFLILGGTGFLGPACMDSILARGHKVTLFNRGRMESRRRDMGRPLDIPEEVEVLYGNRDPNKTADDWMKPEDRTPDSPKGLTSLHGRQWDVVIDNSGYVPRIVRASAQLLAPSVKQYIFISSISAYADNSKPDQDETAPTGTMADPSVEEMGANFENYGPLKVLCEKAAEAAMPGRAATVRPGYIVGRGDTTGRFNYWGLRVEEGGEVLAPGAPTDPIQIIDVRDLADFLVRLGESRTVGTFNACGPTSPHTMKGVLDTAKQVTASDATFTWVPAEFMEKHNFQVPIWLPPTGTTAGFHRWSNARATAAGLTFRTLADTIADMQAWHKSLTLEGLKGIRERGPKREDEATVLQAWHERE